MKQIIFLVATVCLFSASLVQGTFLPGDLQLYGSRTAYCPDFEILELNTVNMSFNGTLTAFETEARVIFTKTLSTVAIKSTFQTKGRVTLLPAPKIVEDYDDNKEVAPSNSFYSIPAVQLIATFDDISTIEREVKIQVSSSGSYFIKGSLEFYNDIPALAYVKINDQYAWIVPLQTTGNICTASSNSGFNTTSMVAKTNDVFRSKVILNDSKTEITIKFGVNFNQKCLILLKQIQQDLKVSAFEFKDVLLVKSK